MAGEAFVDLPASSYPFTICLIDVDTDKQYLEITVEEPGMTHIPLKPDWCRKAKCIVKFADGTTVEDV